MSSKKLDDLCEILSGNAFKSKEYVDEGIRVIRITNVQRGEIVDNDPKYMPYSTQELYSKYLLDEGDILISQTGNVGRVGKVPSQILPAFLNQRVAKISNKSPDELLDDYLFWVLNNEAFERDALYDSSGVAQKNLSMSWIKNYKIPLPSLDEQKAIVAKLDRAQRLIDIDKTMLEKYDELIQSVFLDMFGDPVTNPKGWEVKRFDDLVADDCPLTYGIVQPGDEVINGVPCVRPVDLTQQFISVKGIKRISPEISSKYARTLLKGGEILLSVRGSVGEISIADHTLQDANVTRGIVPIWFDKSISSKLFFYYLYKTKRIQEKIKSLSRGATLVQLNLKELRSLELIAPPISKQHEFEKYAKEVNMQWKLSDLSLAKSEELFSSLVQEVFG